MKNNKELKAGDIVYYRIMSDDSNNIIESGIAILREKTNHTIWPYEGIILFKNKVGLFDYGECVYLASMDE